MDARQNTALFFAAIALLIIVSIAHGTELPARTFTVIEPRGVPVNGTALILWNAEGDGAFDGMSFNASLVERTYSSNSSNVSDVDGEIRNQVCENVTGAGNESSCSFDTNLFPDGRYAIAVSTDGEEQYSNDFQILNHPPHAPEILVIEPRGVPVNGTGIILWNASDADGDALSFTAFIVKRLYDPLNATHVIGESRTPACTTLAYNCTFDSTLFADGNYVAVVNATDGLFAVQGYSNDFLISNAPVATAQASPSSAAVHRGRRRVWFNSTNETAPAPTPISEDNVTVNVTAPIPDAQTNATLEIHETQQLFAPPAVAIAPPQETPWAALLILAGLLLIAIGFSLVS